MTGNKLSEQDVNRLLADPSGEARAEMAAKIAADFDAGELTGSERKMAEDIFRLMVKDAEVRVREALSQNLKENPTVPHDVAMSLARDVDSVALPVLQFSEALSDEDLIEIVRSQAAIDVARETEYDGGDRDRERYSRRMIERILTQYGDLGVDFDSDDLEYLLTKMDQLPPDTLGAA